MRREPGLGRMCEPVGVAVCGEMGALLAPIEPSEAISIRGIVLEAKTLKVLRCYLVKTTFPQAVLVGLAAKVALVEPKVLAVELLSASTNTRDLIGKLLRRSVFNRSCRRKVVSKAYVLIKLVTFTHSHLTVSAHKPALLLVRLYVTEGRRRALGPLKYRPQNAERLVDELAQARSRRRTQGWFAVLYSRRQRGTLQAEVAAGRGEQQGQLEAKAVGREARER